MTNVELAVHNAREIFDIKNFPGNFFNIMKNITIDSDDILLFKEDIGKLSGFIGYGEKDLVVICVNYKRPIGHQNFTLAHELGHYFIHKGECISDKDSNLYSNYYVEKEANDFASELLYPKANRVKDYEFIIENNLFRFDNRKALAIFIDDCCHKYCLSFEMVLRKVLYEAHKFDEYKKVRKEIEKALGSKISEYFDKDFYVPNDELEEYQMSKEPYKKLEKDVDRLLENEKIGTATAESIKYRYGLL